MSDEDQNLPDFDSVLTGPVDMTALLTRRMAWDTTMCDGVPELLTALGLTHGSDEGMRIDHAESHDRMSQVLPVEGMLEAYASVAGAVLSTAVMEIKGLEMSEEDELAWASQNAELILAGSRAILAQLMSTGIIGWGPLVNQMTVVMNMEGIDGE